MKNYDSVVFPYLAASYKTFVNYMVEWVPLVECHSYLLEIRVSLLLSYFALYKSVFAKIWNYHVIRLKSLNPRAFLF